MSIVKIIIIVITFNVCFGYPFLHSSCTYFRYEMHMPTIQKDICKCDWSRFYLDLDSQSICLVMKGYFKCYRPRLSWTKSITVVNHVLKKTKNNGLKEEWKFATRKMKRWPLLCTCSLLMIWFWNKSWLKNEFHIFLQYIRGSDLEGCS